MEASDNQPSSDGIHSLFAQARESGSARDPQPSAEELAVIFPLWEMLETISQDLRSHTLKIRHRESGKFARLTLRRDGESRHWRGRRPVIESPHIVPIVEWGAAGDDTYLIYEDFEGPTLADAIDQGRVSRKIMLTCVGRQIEEALKEAHHHKFLLDTRPEAIFYDEEREQVWLFPMADDSHSVTKPFWREENTSIGERIGPYLLKGLLGEGGFAEVYLAEQQEPINRHVALKLLKLGMDSKEVLQRFKAERQALARLNHPHIASIYDAGVTKEDRPYFVMEAVDGEPLTTHVDQRGLGLHEKLTLFQKVADAVSHAHRQGIIHRDLKPGNILVAKDDRGEPIPKIIDFGIAKATRQPLTEETLHTRFYHLVGSLAYMSPEQASMNQEVDERADVYALGCVLYEMLTERTPLGRRTSDLAPIDALAIIRDKLPPVPSQVAPKGRRISRDLDAVVMKALEKESAERYESVAAFAEDIENVLAGRAVSVRAPGLGYRVRRLLSDQRAKAAIFAGLGAAVVALAFSLWPKAPYEPPPPEPISFTAKSRTSDGKVVPVSLWNFDRGYENAIENGPPIRVVGEPVLEFQASEIDGETAQVLSFPKMLTTEYLTAVNPIQPNGWAYATDTNEYSLVMDVMFPKFPYRNVALMQAATGNYGAAEWSINKALELTSKSYHGGRIEPGRWTRVGLTVAVRGTSQLIRLYVDGQSSGFATPQGKVDSHMGLNEEIHFFSDGNGNSGEGFVNSIALYDVVLNEAEMAALGGAAADGVPLTIDQQDEAPASPEVIQRADHVIAPPEPGRDSPTYGLDLHDDRLLVYQSYASGRSGGVWVYAMESDAWTLQQTVEPPANHEDHWNFGFSASLTEDWVVVSSQSQPVRGLSKAGIVYLSNRQDPSSFAQPLPNDDPSAMTLFGKQLWASDHTLVVNAYGRKNDDDPSKRLANFLPRARIFHRALNADGSEEWKLAKVTDHQIRGAVFPDDDTVFMKGRWGTLYRYERVADTWNLAAEFKPEGAESVFGMGLASDQDTLLVGSPRPQSQQAGEVLILKRHQGGKNAWGVAGRIPAPVVAADYHFGWSIAFEDDQAVISCLSADKKSVKVYQYAREPGEEEIWKEIAQPLDLPEVNHHVLSVRYAAAALPYEGGRVCVYDLERWAEENPWRLPTPSPYQIRGSASSNGAHFGYGLAAEGAEAIVGAWNEFGPNKEQAAGEAYVFRRDSQGRWQESQRLMAPTPFKGARFGSEVAMDGDLAVISAFHEPYRDQARVGAVYVYQRVPDGTWKEQARLRSPNPAKSEAFGVSVDLEGTTLVVGAYAFNDRQTPGAVYVYQYANEDWTLTAQIRPAGGRPNTLFGSCVDLQGDRLLISAWERDIGTGYAELYQRNVSDGTWSSIARFDPPDGVVGEGFGYSVSLDGKNAAVGSYDRAVGKFKSAGAVCLFEENADGQWSFRKRLTAPALRTNQRFGICLLKGDDLYVGERGDAQASGGCHRYQRHAGGPNQWGLVHTYSGEYKNGYAGRGLAFAGDQLLMGEGRGGKDGSGRVHVFEVSDGPQPSMIPGKTNIVQAEGGHDVADPNGTAGLSMPLCTEDQKILNPSTVSPGSDWFGSKLDLDGKRAIIGAQRGGESGRGTTAGPGAAYIYEQDANGRWIPAKDSSDNDVVLSLPSGITHNDRFGAGMAIEGDIAVVGARSEYVGGFNSAGKAFVYQRQSDDDWVEVASLQSPTPEAGGGFGWAIDLSATTLVVSANGEQSGQGRAYVFERHAGGSNAWGLAKTIVPSDTTSATFSWDVGIEGDTLVVTAPAFNGTNKTSRLFIYDRNEGGKDNWGEVANRVPANIAVDEQFGYSVALSGDVVVVGANRDDVSGQALSGAAYVFHRDRDNDGSADWNEVATLTATNAGSGAAFGSSVAMNGDYLAVGANLARVGIDENVGAVYVFKREGEDASSWKPVTRWEQSDPNVYDTFGSHMAISAGNILASAHGDDEVAGGAGAVYALSLPVFEDQDRPRDRPQ